MIRKLKPPLNRPPDFDVFWTRTLEELAAVEINAKTSRAPGEYDPKLIHEYVSFDSLGGCKIHGYLLHADDDTPRPLVVYTHGYLDQVQPMWDWAKAGVNVLGFDVRGFGLSQEAVPEISEWGYVLTGIESPESHILRGAVCDFIRAVEAGQEIMGPKASKQVTYSKSFGGALALMAEALKPKAELLAIATPTFGWSEGRFFFAEYGSGFEVNKYLKARPEQSEDVMSVLRYFDTMNFSAAVKCPTLVGVGLEDKVVPGETVFAVANHLQCPHEIMEFPMSHTRSSEEDQIWSAFERRWIHLSLEGVPHDFGTPKTSLDNPEGRV